MGRGKRRGDKRDDNEERKGERMRREDKRGGDGGRQLKERREKTDSERGEWRQWVYRKGDARTGGIIREYGGDVVQGTR